MTSAPPPVVGPLGRLAHSNRLGTGEIMPQMTRPGESRGALPSHARQGIRAYSRKSCFQPGLPPLRGRRCGLRGAAPPHPCPGRKSVAATLPSGLHTQILASLDKPSSIIFQFPDFQPGLSAAAGAPTRFPGRTALGTPSLASDPTSPRR